MGSAFNHFSHDGTDCYFMYQIELKEITEEDGLAVVYRNESGRSQLTKNGFQSDFTVPSRRHRILAQTRAK